MTLNITEQFFRKHEFNTDFADEWTDDDFMERKKELVNALRKSQIISHPI